MPKHSFTSFHWPSRRAVFITGLLVVVTGLSLAAVIAPFSTIFYRRPLQAGDVALQDIQAPYALVFNSDNLTQRERQEKAADVAPIYSQADTSIARRQLEKLRTALSFIDTVRSDIYATAAQKLDDISKLESIQINPETAKNILSLSNPRWQAVEQESIAVLEQVMRNTIRDDRLEDARRTVPATINLSLPEDQAAIVAEMVQNFVVPNSLYDAAMTEAARKQASEAVEPVKRSFMAGEIIVTRGSIISPDEMEALNQYGLVQPSFRWQDLASAAVLVLVMMAFLAFYLQRSHAFFVGAPALRSLTLIGFLFLAFLIAARLTIPGHTIIPYVFPVAAYSLIVSALFGAEAALVTSLPLAVMTSYELGNSLELTMYYTLGCFFGVLVFGHAKRVTSFLGAGLAVAGSGLAVVLVYRLPQTTTTDWVGIATLAAASLVNGIASGSITLVMQFLLAQILDMTTPLQLIELARPDHPLLQLLLRTAPGTYQHSLQVANLAEQAAERIGADALLTRVGALYHDAGKAVNSIFFIENQLPGNVNSHEDLDPDISAAMVIAHVKEGLTLARKYHLPRRVQDFIAEHHGTMLTRYQYCQAVELCCGDESQVNREKFRYPGPRPQTRETALLMLADGCEARVRAERPKDEEELRALVKSLVDSRVASGELNDTNLTLNDLDLIKESFTATLRGIYHPRIQYPAPEPVAAPQEETARV